MPGITLDLLKERLNLADELRSGRETMLTPQDLPGRYGRVVRAIDHVLETMQCPAVVAGGWAVWRHGFVGRVTQDVDIVLPADRVEEFLRLAGVSGFSVLTRPAGRWPRALHKDTNVEVDIFPEHGRPGTASRPAPTTIRHPSEFGAEGWSLVYATLPALVELKLAAGRIGDEHDVVELIRANPEQVAALRQHLANTNPQYVKSFNALVDRAKEQQD